MNKEVLGTAPMAPRQVLLNPAALAPGPARSIVSLVPSLTELLYYLGLDEAVTGITKFCVHPTAWWRSKTRVGGTKQVKPDVIRRLAPGLVLANKEENVKEQVEALAQYYPVYVSDVYDLPSACDMMITVGQLTGRAEAANNLVAEVKRRFALLAPPPQPAPAAYLIWQKPFMTVGGDTFIDNMMGYCGLRNVFAQYTRYPEIDAGTIRRAGCRFVLLSSEPFPFSEKHVAELQAQLPGVEVLLVDGEMFSWYGSRLLEAAEYFQALRANLKIKNDAM